MTETQLTILILSGITFLASFVKGKEFVPAVLYCAVSWFLFMITFNMTNQAAMLLLSSFSDLVLISLLYWIKRCTLSRIASILMPISIAGICMDITGYYGLLQGDGLVLYYGLLAIYWVTIAALFIWHWRRDGNIIFQPRFLRDTANGH